MAHMAAHHTADTASLFAEEKNNNISYPCRNYLKLHEYGSNLPLLGSDKCQYSESVKFVQFNSLVESAFIYTNI